VIWLEADERIEAEMRFEEKKAELEIQRNHVSSILTMLCDLRKIGMRQIASTFASEIDYNDFLYSMPSFKGDAKKAKAEMRWTVKTRKPGEIPEWKRKLQNQNNTCQTPKTG
jgi:hypothetical protein